MQDIGSQQLNALTQSQQSRFSKRLFVERMRCYRGQFAIVQSYGTNFSCHDKSAATGA